MKLKTLNDINDILNHNFDATIKKLVGVTGLDPSSREDTHHGWIAHETAIKKEAMNWIIELRKKSDAHWKRLDNSHYTEFDKMYPNLKDEDCWGYNIGGMHIEDHHEASGSSDIIMWIKLFFNIEEKDINEYINSKSAKAKRRARKN